MLFNSEKRLSISNRGSLIQKEAVYFRKRLSILNWRSDV